MRRILTRVVVATACMLGLNGCAVLVAGSAAGVGTIAYIQGELKEQLPASPDEVRTAIAGTVQRLELKKIEVEADNLSGDYVLQTGSNEKVTIHYEKVRSRVTEISIRVGVFGNEHLSRMVLDEIKQEL